MGKKNRNLFYAVAVGRTPGIYSSWGDCRVQTDGFKSAKFKSFSTKEQALVFIESHGVLRLDEEGAEVSSLTSSFTDTEPSAKRQKVAFIDKHKQKHKIIISIHFDGGSRGNPGTGGAGAQLLVTETSNSDEKMTNQRDTLIHLSRFLSHQQQKVTNNEAEYHGLLLALEEAFKQVNTFAKRHSSAPTSACQTFEAILQIRGDSDLILHQMKGNYQVRSINLLLLHNQANKLVKSIQNIMDSQFHYEHVRRANNTFADALANQAMDTQTSSNAVISTRMHSNDNNPVISDSLVPGGVDV